MQRDEAIENREAAELQSVSLKRRRLWGNADLLNCSAGKIAQARQQFFAHFLFFRHANNARGGWCRVCGMVWAGAASIVGGKQTAGGAASSGAAPASNSAELAARRNQFFHPRLSSSRYVVDGGSPWRGSAPVVVRWKEDPGANGSRLYSTDAAAVFAGAQRLLLNHVCLGTGSQT